MVMTVKIYTLSYTVYDGAGPGKRAIDAVLASATAKDAERRIMTERRERSVPGLPSPLPMAAIRGHPTFGPHLAAARLGHQRVAFN